MPKEMGNHDGSDNTYTLQSIKHDGMNNTVFMSFRNDVTHEPLYETYEYFAITKSHAMMKVLDFMENLDDYFYNLSDIDTYILPNELIIDLRIECEKYLDNNPIEENAIYVQDFDISDIDGGYQMNIKIIDFQGNYEWLNYPKEKENPLDAESLKNVLRDIIGKKYTGDVNHITNTMIKKLNTKGRFILASNRKFEADELLINYLLDAKIFTKQVLA